jgi:hypothetical protein
LTTVRRWAASPNVFTLDFGDYQDQYYSVQTTEGEQISQLIAGYIDIILKRRQRKERFGDDGNEEEAMEEDLVTPGRAITMVGLPGSNYKKAEASNLAKPGVLRNSGGAATLEIRENRMETNTCKVLLYTCCCEWCVKHFSRQPFPHTGWTINKTGLGPVLWNIQCFFFFKT